MIEKVIIIGMSLKDIIRVPYTTRPYMVKNNLPLYNSQPCEKIIKQKHQQLNIYKHDLHGMTAQAQTLKLVDMVSNYLGKSSTHDIKELALQFEEDIAVLYNGILSAICFCFPSSWIPGSKIGQSLKEIHSPVADGSALIKASPKISQTISNYQQGSFRRSVWTISKVPGLSNFPDENLKYKDTKIDLDHLYFRTEIQTTCALPDNQTSVFFVKVQVTPLKTLWSEYRDLILDSMNSMSDSVLEYKSLNEIKTYLNKH